MKNEEQIAYRFNAFKKGNPYVGDYLILSKAVRGMKYGKMKVYDAFNKYVPKGDYAKDEKDMLMENLVMVTNRNDKPEIPLLLAPDKN